MKAIITNESKDNNPSPLEEYVNDSFRQMSYAFGMLDGRQEYLIEARDKILSLNKQALTNYANMVESLEGLREKYKKLQEFYLSMKFKDMFNSSSYTLYDSLESNTRTIIADITKVLEGKI